MADGQVELRNDSELEWTEIEPGTGERDFRSTLFGDPSQVGVYTIRLRLSPSYKGGRPHWHPAHEFGTVLAGTFWVATGTHLDRADARRLNPGAFIVIPPRVKHAIWTEGEVILQIHGPGPRETRFDDPG